MNPTDVPHESDFLQLFMVEPTTDSASAEEVWLYRPNSYELKTGDETLLVTIWPGEGALSLTWTRGDSPILDLRLDGVASWHIENGKTRTYLEARFGESARAHPLCIQVHPRWHVSWGCDRS
ncbi:MAG: hypothetical protein JST54_22770 [Deltaproteobacteria bacterium]|nr:hypothetical protein [Deltaproteobacteria bacterium]